MKHLLNGVAIAATLVIAAPVWAQAPAAPASPAAPTAAPAAPMAPTKSQASPYTKGAQPHQSWRGTRSGSDEASTASTHSASPYTKGAQPHRHWRGTRSGSSGSTADQLNHEELVVIQGGGTPPPPAYSASPYGKAGQPK
jgi:hypothetical protein